MADPGDCREPVSQAVLVQRPPASSSFKMVFISVLVVTVLCLVSQVLLAALWPQPTLNQQGVSDALGFAWKTGLGSIVGLLGGKVA